MLNHRFGGALALYALVLCRVSNGFADEPPGSLDTSFMVGSGADATVHSIAVQADGKILFGGVFNHYNGNTRHQLVRILPFGSIDAGFDSPITDPLADVLSIAVQTNGQIVIGLDSEMELMRLNVNGSVDAGFNIGFGPDRPVHTVLLQPDGKILIGGEFRHFNGVTRSRLARLNTNGTLDSTFDPGLGPDQTVFCLALQPDGRILAGGQFTHYGLDPRNSIVRILTNGVIDTTFTPGQGADQTVYTINLQADGKPIISGFFSSYDGHPQDAVARLNIDGTYDASFTSLADLHDGTVFAAQLQRDGKVVVAGDMTTGHLVRLNTNGTKDLTYQPGAGPDDDVYAMAIQPDQKIVIGGLFVDVNATPINFLARINSDLKLLSPVKSGSVFTTQIQSVSGKIYHLEYKDALTNATWTSIPASTVTGDGTIKMLQDASASALRRFYHVVGVSD